MFDLAAAELTSCALFEAKSLKFRFEEADSPYWVEAGGVAKRIVTEEVQPVPRSEPEAS